MLSGEGTIQVNRYQTNLLTLSSQVVDRLTDSLRYRAHGDDHTLSVGRTIVVEQTVRTTRDLADLVHILLNDSRHSVIESVRRLTMLEEVVGVLCHTTCNRVLRVQRTRTELSQCLLVDQRSQIVVLQLLDLLDLMRGTETIEEVHERNTALQGSQVSHTGQVHHLLHRALAQHGEACLTTRHHILVVTEDTQRMRSQRTCRYMEDARQQLTSDLIHVRDHQQQTLRGGVSRSQRTSLQRAVNSTGSTTLRLHLLHLDGLAKNVLTPCGSPLIHMLSHSR